MTEIQDVITWLCCFFWVSCYPHPLSRKRTDSFIRQFLKLVPELYQKPIFSTPTDHPKLQF